MKFYPNITVMYLLRNFKIKNKKLYIFTPIPIFPLLEKLIMIQVPPSFMFNNNNNLHKREGQWKSGQIELRLGRTT